MKPGSARKSAVVKGGPFFFFYHFMLSLESEFISYLLFIKIFDYDIHSLESQ